jgi:hypothetical protein
MDAVLRASSLVLIGMLACADAPTSAVFVPANGVVRDGAASYDGLELALQSFWIGWGIEPVPGPRLDALGFRLVNGATGWRDFDPRAVWIETADGTWWPRVLVGTDPELRPIALAASEDAFGWIVFRVAAGAVPVAVVWTPAPGLALRIPLAEGAKP